MDDTTSLALERGRGFPGEKMDVYSIDYETSSFADIRKVGAYRYAADPSTAILLFAIRRNDEPVVVWRMDRPDSLESQQACQLFREAIASRSVLRAFNAQFEVAICKYVLTRQLGIPEPDTCQWRCSMALCNRAAIRSNLSDASEDLGLGSLKDKRGKALIDIFSNRLRKVTLFAPEGSKEKNRHSFSPIHEEEVPWDWRVKVAGETMTVREAWELFVEYCRKDVIAESAVASALKSFELSGDDLDSFLFDLRMNYKGVPVNEAALRHTLALTDQFTAKMSERFREICGIEHTRRDRVLEWLKAEGYPFGDLKSNTVGDALKDTSMLTEAGAEALRLRSQLSFAALKKIPTMLGAVCPDGYIRGTTLWHGARTGRATGRLVQPQNFKKATINESKLAYWMLCDGDPLSEFEGLWESPLEVFASCIRHFIQPHEGGFYNCDFSSVENKLAAWVVGDIEELQMMIDGVDMYKHMASLLFGVPYDEVTKEQRNIAKPVVLGCGYGVAGKSLQASLMMLFKVEKTRKECDEYVKIYRQTHTHTVQAWRDLEDAAKAAVRRPGKTFRVLGDRVGFLYGRKAGIPYLTMKLPSGRSLHYPHPTVKSVFKKYDKEDMENDPWKKEKGGYWTDELSYHGKLQGKAFWGRIPTWGSRLLENLCQAMGVDLLNHGCLRAEESGFDIRMIIHDEILSLESPQSIEKLLEKFCSVPPWAATFPQKATGAWAPYYLKD